MNEPDQTLLLSQLAMARTNAQLGASHCQEAAQLGAIVGLTEIPKINLARVHFELAFEQLTRALQSFVVQPLGCSPGLAPQALECGVSAPLSLSAPNADAEQHSPSLPKTEDRSVIETPADTSASCEADGSEGVLSTVSASISNLKSQI